MPARRGRRRALLTGLHGGHLPGCGGSRPFKVSIRVVQRGLGPNTAGFEGSVEESVETQAQFLRRPSSSLSYLAILTPPATASGASGLLEPGDPTLSCPLEEGVDRGTPQDTCPTSYTREADLLSSWLPSSLLSGKTWKVRTARRGLCRWTLVRTARFSHHRHCKH